MSNYKKIIAFAIFLLVKLNSFGQSNDAAIKWGPELKGSKRTSVNSIIGQDDSGFYIEGRELIKNGYAYNIILEKLDRNMNSLAKFTVEEKDPVTKISYNSEGLSWFQNNILLFKSTIDKDKKKNILFLQTINKKTMVPDGKLVKVAELDYDKKRATGSFIYKNSRNSDKLLVVCVPPKTKDEEEDFNDLIVFDSNLDIVWNNRLTNKYPKTVFSPIKWVVDEDGNAYILGKLYKDKIKEVSKGIQNFDYHIIAYTNKGQNTIDYEVKIPEKFVTEITFTIDDKKDIVCSGFYSKDNLRSIDGCFYLKLDPATKKVKMTNFKEFDLDFLTEGMSEKQESKARKKDEKGKDVELMDYDLDKIIIKEDGGCILIGEQYKVVSRTVSNGKSTYTTTTYYYNDIIVVNISSEGRIEWAKKIPKRQSSADGGVYLSYGLAVTKDKIRIIFNDDAKNIDPKRQGDWEKYYKGDKNGIVTLATIRMDGAITREKLFDISDAEVVIKPTVCKQYSDEEIILFGEKSKLDQYAIITFKD